MIPFIATLALLVPACLAHSGKENFFEARERLERDLFHHYDKDIIPQMEENKPVNFSAGLSVYSMDMDEHGVLNMVAWYRGYWEDERLMWHPEDYHGIKQLRVPASKVWAPDMEVYNAEDFGDNTFSHSMVGERHHNAIVMSTGHVLYVPPTRVSIRCNEQEYKDWPWGEYECALKMGSWTFSSEQMDLHPFNGVTFIKFEEFGVDHSPFVFTEGSFAEEPLQSKLYDCCPEEYQSLEYKFKVQRQFRFTENGVEHNPNSVNRFQEPEGKQFY